MLEKCNISENFAKKEKLFVCKYSTYQYQFESHLVFKIELRY
jgi:hypothetical protein